MCLRRLNSPRLSVLIPSKTSAVPPEVDPDSPKQVKTNSSRLTEELHERFSITTTDGTSAMFIFHALVLSLTRPNFFSRAIIEPRVQTPLPAPPALPSPSNLEPRVSPALCQRLVAGTNSGIMEFLSLKSWDTVCNAHACN